MPHQQGADVQQLSEGFPVGGRLDDEPDTHGSSRVIKGTKTSIKR
jgi:hypothetical protein